MNNNSSREDWGLVQLSSARLACPKLWALSPELQEWGKRPKKFKVHSEFEHGLHKTPSQEKRKLHHLQSTYWRTNRRMCNAIFMV